MFCKCFIYDDLYVGVVLKCWSFKLAIIDVLWGGIVYFLPSYLTFKIQDHQTNNPLK